MTREQIHIGDMSHETAIGILKLMLEAMETYDGISPTPQRINAMKMAIKALEQEPQIRPKGHWITTGDYYTGAYGSIDYVECSCCGEDSLEEGDYCPNCGAEMSEVEE